MFVEAAKISDIACGGMIPVRIEGQDLVICNYNHNFFCVSRRCSHLNASLDKGSLDGYILTCPLHFAQFDITTGEALSGPVPPDQQISGLKTYPLRVEGGLIKVEVSPTDQAR